MDTLGALALATEPPTDHLMHRTPVGRRWIILQRHIFDTKITQSNESDNLFTGRFIQRASHYKYHVAESSRTGNAKACVYILVLALGANGFFLQAMYQVTVLLTLNFAGRSILDLGSDRAQAEVVKNTIIFNTFVLCQVSTHTLESGLDKTQIGMLNVNVFLLADI